MGAVRKVPPDLVGLRGSDPCPCGSGKTVKECCGEAFRTFSEAFGTFSR